MTYLVPCIFTPEEGGGYSVTFPDIAGGTDGDTLSEAFDMAVDAANGMFMLAEDRGETPHVTAPNDVKLETGQFMTLVKVDTDAYRKMLAQTQKQSDSGAA